MIQARYEITVSDLDAAEETMKLSRSLWMPITDEERMKLLPSTQVTAAKALIELEMHDDAHTLLERVLEENDEVYMTSIYYICMYLPFLYYIITITNVIASLSNNLIFIFQINLVNVITSALLWYVEFVLKDSIQIALWGHRSGNRKVSLIYGRVYFAHENSKGEARGRSRQMNYSKRVV